MNSIFACSLRLLSRLMIAGLCGLGCATAAAAQAHPVTVEQWDVFELSLAGPDTGNPFTEVELVGRFIRGGSSVQAAGFYDGAGVYKIRFMPEASDFRRG